MTISTLSSTVRQVSRKSSSTRTGKGAFNCKSSGRNGSTRWRIPARKLRAKARLTRQYRARHDSEKVLLPKSRNSCQAPG
ncbi:MAG: hypothetical protein ACXAEU_01555 [Candidatus Hodarchaeales archaeon]